MKELILVIEDSLTQAMILENFLQKQNFDVVIASDGQKAIDWLTVSKPALVISDIVMPDMNGFDLCRRIKSANSTAHLPVILLTSLNDSSEIMKGIACGADSFVTKPYNEHFLLSIIEKLLSKDEVPGEISESLGLKIPFEGTKRIIRADNQQVNKLLLSVYEGAILQNYQLIKVQEELRSLNENLESLVKERTIALFEEIKMSKQTVEKLLESENRYRKAEIELIKAKEQAEESDRLKSAFLANMSHEIRTPMNGILGFAELLKEPNLTGEDQQDYIRFIEKSGERMLNIINDILVISKIEIGQIEVSISETNIKEQINFLHSSFKQEADQKGIQIFTRIPQTPNEIILNTDHEKLNTILSNLIKNSLKFTKSGSIDFGYELVETRLIASLPSQSHIQFFVKDSGVGIAEYKKEIIFEKFRQGSESLTRDYEGAGLGLFIAKAYVEILDGSIWFENNSVGKSGGAGTTFYFTIPYNVNPLDNEEINKADLDERLPDRGNSDIPKLKILIVEDDELSRLFLINALKSLSKKTFSAVSGVEAVEICRNNPDIDLIIMDIKMPGINGYKATRQIRQFNKKAIIIAQTAFALYGDRDEATEAGFNDYIVKPVNKGQIVELVKKYFR